MSRQAIRARIQYERDARSKAEIAAKSRLAQQNLIASPCWQAAKAVALYMAIKKEAATDLLLANALATGKSVWLPRIVDPLARRMQFCEFGPADRLERGQWGICEPPAGPEPGRLDLLLLPGLAFDLAGNRLGYGAGYYDRYLAAHPWPEAPRIGLCLTFQIIGQIPAENWDVPVRALCCEDGLRWL